MVDRMRSLRGRIRIRIPKGDQQRGQSLIIVAFLIVALLAAVGLAVDLGLMYVEKVRLGRAVDAAALAGAQELPDTSAARSRAVEYINLNGYDENAEDFDFRCSFISEPECTGEQCYYHIVISGTKQVNLTFMRVLGFETVDISAHAIGENANRLDIAIVIDVSGSMDDDTCLPAGTMSNGCSPWWDTATELFFEDFEEYDQGDYGGEGYEDRLCGANSPWSCEVDSRVGAYSSSRSIDGQYAQTEGVSGGDDGLFYRYLDTSAYPQVEILFQERTYSAEYSNYPYDRDYIRGWHKPGISWTTFMSYYRPSNSTWRQRAFFRDTQSSSDYGLRFGVYSMESYDYAYFDNIKVSAVTPGVGPYIEVECPRGDQYCTCATANGEQTLQCGYDNLASRYRPQPLWDTLNAANWFINECTIPVGEDVVPCLDPELDQVGLASYSDDGYSSNYYPGSGDSATASELVGGDFSSVTTALWTQFNAEGYTNIGDGIYRGCEILSTNEAEGHHGRTNAVHVMILLSDGNPNRPCTYSCGDSNPTSLAHIDDAVDWAVQNGIVIFTISLGGAADPVLMGDIADATGGTHSYAESTDQLVGIFQDIAQHIFLRLVR
jgi:hypothetical protein